MPVSYDWHLRNKTISKTIATHFRWCPQLSINDELTP